MSQPVMRISDTLKLAQRTHLWLGGLEVASIWLHLHLFVRFIHWHMAAKAACDPFGKYPKFKNWCVLFLIRGVGGLFFDDLSLGTFDQICLRSGEILLENPTLEFSKKDKPHLMAKDKEISKNIGGEDMLNSTLCMTGGLFLVCSQR